MIAPEDVRFVGVVAAIWLVLAVLVIAFVLPRQPRRAGRHVGGETEFGRAAWLAQRLGHDPAPRTVPLALAPRELKPVTPVAGLPPLVIAGPPGTRGALPVQRVNGAPVVRQAWCSRCWDRGFLGGCSWCGAHPRHDATDGVL